MLTSTVCLLIAGFSVGCTALFANQDKAPGNWSSYLERTGNSTQVVLSRKRRFFAPLPSGATFILTPKFTMPIPGLAPGGSELHIEVPLSFALPSLAAEMPASEGARFNEAGDNMDSYSYYRSLEDDKANMYNYAENFISRFGLDGRQCVLRTICEVAEAPVENAGVMGEVVNTLLRSAIEPDEDQNDAQMQDYVKAERRGKMLGQCEEYYSACPMSLFQLV